MTSSIFQATHPKHVTRQIVFEGIDPNTPDEEGDPALHCALKRRVSLETLAELVRLGARVNLTNAAGQTAVLLSVFHHDPEALRLMLDVGGIADSPKGHLTPLHAAVFNGLDSQADLLLARGADPNHQGTNGVSPLFLASTRQMALRLIAKGGDPYVRNLAGVNAIEYWKSEQSDALEALQKPKAPILSVVR
jgi:hypothetical protein